MILSVKYLVQVLKLYLLYFMFAFTFFFNLYLYYLLLLLFDIHSSIISFEYWSYSYPITYTIISVINHINPSAIMNYDSIAWQMSTPRHVVFLDNVHYFQLPSSHTTTKSTPFNPFPPSFIPHLIVILKVVPVFLLDLNCRISRSCWSKWKHLSEFYSWSSCSNDRTSVQLEIFHLSRSCDDVSVYLFP